MDHKHLRISCQKVQFAAPRRPFTREVFPKRNFRAAVSLFVPPLDSAFLDRLAFGKRLQQKKQNRNYDNVGGRKAI